MYRCQKCGKDNQDVYKFCLGCGAHAPERRPREPNPGEVPCPSCGLPNPAQLRFCQGCGGGLAASAAGATTFRDFAPRIVYALYIAHQQVTTRPDHQAHVAIIAGAILAAARSMQTGVTPSIAVLGRRTGPRHTRRRVLVRRPARDRLWADSRLSSSVWRRDVSTRRRGPRRRHTGPRARGPRASTRRRAARALSRSSERHA